MDERVTVMTDPTVRVVTLSAGYGAGASIVGPSVAERLGLPYLERVFSPSLVRAAAAGSEGTTREEHSARFLDRLVDSLAGIPLDLGAGAPQPVEDVNADEQVRNEMEAGIATLTRPPGGVVRGRGGMIVLRSCPNPPGDAADADRRAGSHPAL